MSAKQTLLKAAEMIASGEEEYSCRAIARAIGAWHPGQPSFGDEAESAVARHPAGRAYAALLGRLPTVCDFGPSENMPWAEYAAITKKERVIALCFAAAIAN